MSKECKLVNISNKDSETEANENKSICLIQKTVQKLMTNYVPFASPEYFSTHGVSVMGQFIDNFYLLHSVNL